MTDVSLQTSFRVSDDVVFRELDGEAVLLNLASGIYFGLDAVGTRVWQLIEQHGRLDTVLERMCEEYDAPADVLQRDLLRIASELAQKGLVVSGDAAASAR